jgi:hypothetical protein
VVGQQLHFGYPAHFNAGPIVCIARRHLSLVSTTSRSSLDCSAYPQRSWRVSKRPT